MTRPTGVSCNTPWPTEGPDSDRLLGLLATGQLTLTGSIPWSSNYTFLADVTDGEQAVQVIYKPIRGEQPLWDFPRGSLARREVAAYAVSRSLGWHFVPPTVLRRNGPYGRGSVQFFVAVDQDAHFFTFRTDPAFQHGLRALCLFDIITNNADRKGGHCLRAGDGCIIAIDQGLCFHVEDKLRTVIWDFAGQPLPTDLSADLSRLVDALAAPEGALRTVLSPLLDAGEIARLRHRAEALLETGIFPQPPENRRPYPWPLV